ncbi:hypothetical protein NM208_g12322 [Fusarium decemcellulare]|uniref:Uncharacterized protein n=1 Tax=Fusarium decemcellulare TaxID=57161 RepID=A0ACC1RQY0_9HYPO|nr:hypothetical protein NM208_g12322 [Fusarium decemcellulare]
MRVHTIALLSAAALAPSVAGVAVPRDILNRQASGHFPLNNTAVATAPDGSTTRLLTAPTSTSQLETTTTSSTSTSAFSISSLTTEAVEATFLTSRPMLLQTVASLHPYDSHSPAPWMLPLTLLLYTALLDGTLSPSTVSDADSGASSVETDDSLKVSANKAGPHQISDHSFTTAPPNYTRPCNSTDKAECGWIPSITSKWNGTHTPGTLTVLPPTTSTPCTTLPDDEPITEFSIVYTATVTFLGNRSEYTPPYPTITTPNYCPEPFPSISLSPIAPGGTASGDITTIAFGVSSKEPAEPCSAGDSCVDEEAPGWSNPTEAPKESPPPMSFSSSRVTVTFVTTDKNPAVVFPSDPPPRFGQPTQGSRAHVSQKQKPEPSGVMRPDDTSGKQPGDKPDDKSDENPDDKPGDKSDGNSDGKSNGKQDEPDEQESSGGQKTARPRPQPQNQPPKTFAITARGPEVIVNDKTFSGLKPDQSTTVTVDHGTFTIHPTEVVGEGVTVKKPQPVGTAISVVTPTSATVGGVPVVVSGSEAVVDGTRFKIPLIGTATKVEVTVAAGATANVEERPILIQPGKIVVDDETLTYRAVGGPQTDVLIEGGEMMTVVGKSVYVFRSTTLTYGPGIPETSEVVDDDVITVGPSGIIVDGTTLGGVEAETTDTKLQIVGGATITKVSPSFLIIDGTTFTAGPGAKRTTKIIGGETIKIGPSGVAISTMTIRYPFGASTVTTIKALATATDTLPVETGTSNGKTTDRDKKKDDDSGAISQRPGLATLVTGLCIAIGVWVLI